MKAAALASLRRVIKLLDLWVNDREISGHVFVTYGRPVQPAMRAEASMVPSLRFASGISLAAFLLIVRGSAAEEPEPKPGNTVKVQIGDSSDGTEVCKLAEVLDQRR